MFRQSPRRNQRNKGFMVKHALQICLLLAVSIWLLYQVQHLHNKKTTNPPEGLQNAKATVKLGRKDLQPQVEGSATEYVRKHKEDQEEESKPDEQEPDEESEPGAQKEETDESKDTDLQEEVMEDREKESKEKAEDGNKESTEESTDSEKEKGREESNEEESGGKAIKEEEEIKENGSKKIREKSSEESDTIENGDNKENGSEETQEKSSEGNDTTENGDGKENGREETQEKSTEENDSVENGESKENKEVDGESKGSEEKEIRDKKLVENEAKRSEEKEIRDEKLVENKATGSEEREKSSTDEKTWETREEREGTIESSGAAENHKGENVSNEVGQETQNIPETEGGIRETSNAREQIKNNEGSEFEGKGINNTESTSENENNSDSNVTGNATIVKNDSAILIDSEGNKNGTSLLEMDSSNWTTGTTKYTAGKTTSDPTSDTSQNKNKTVDNVVPFGDSSQTVLKEQTEKPEEMTSGENSDLNSAPPATENKGTVNGDSMESFNNTVAVVLEGQSANTSTFIEAQNNSEKSSGKEGNDAVQNQKSDTDSETSGTEEHRELSNENMDADSRQNNAGDSSTSEPVTEKEASSSPNDNADASKESEVNSYSSSKEAHTDLATLPESGTEGNSHNHAAEK